MYTPNTSSYSFTRLLSDSHVAGSQVSRAMLEKSVLQNKLIVS